MINPYKILNVEDNSSIEICKKAWRTLSRKYHPDNNGDANKFDEVQKAWDMINEGNVPCTLSRNNLKFSSLFNFVV